MLYCFLLCGDNTEASLLQWKKKKPKPADIYVQLFFVLFSFTNGTIVYAATAKYIFGGLFSTVTVKTEIYFDSWKQNTFWLLGFHSLRATHINAWQKSAGPPTFRKCLMKWKTNSYFSSKGHGVKFKMCCILHEVWEKNAHPFPSDPSEPLAYGLMRAKWTEVGMIISNENFFTLKLATINSGSE